MEVKTRLKAEPFEIEITELALKEMAPLEAGFTLRDLGLNFPTTMDALYIAGKKMGILRKSLAYQPTIKEIGGCPRPGGAGFSEEQLSKAKKLEIVDYLTGTTNPYTIFYLRGNDNKVIATSRVDKSNIR